MTPQNRRKFLREFRAMSDPKQREILGLYRDFANIYLAKREAARKLE